MKTDRLGSGELRNAWKERAVEFLQISDNFENRIFK